MASADNPSWLEPHLGTCEAIVALFHPFAEVAVHDIRRDRIVALWNPISERRVGDASLLDELPDYPEDARVIGPYPKVLADGRAITSVSVVLHNAKGARRGLLCIDCVATGSLAGSDSRSSGSSTSAACSPPATPRPTRRAFSAYPAPPSTPCSRRPAHEAAAHIPS